MKKILIILLLCCLFTGCNAKSQGTSSHQDAAASDKDISNVSYLDISYGEDYTDLKADITFLTSRSDLIADTDAPFEFPDYLRDMLEIFTFSAPEIKTILSIKVQYLA